MTPIFNAEKRQEINAAFEIVRAFTNESSTFLANRAKESTEAQAKLEAELKKPEDQQNLQTIDQAGKVLEQNQTWAMGGTGRIALTAITGAFSGNITGSAGDLVRSAAVTSLQSLGAQEVKQLASSVGGEGSLAHTALHAILACAGAAASSGDCGTAGLAASAGVVINQLMDSIEGKTSASLTQTEKEARAKLINTLVTGTTAALGGNAVTAQITSQIETENNALQLSSKINQFGNDAMLGCAHNIQACVSSLNSSRKLLLTNGLSKDDQFALAHLDELLSTRIESYLQSASGPSELQSRLMATGMSAVMATSLITMTKACENPASCIIAALPLIDQLQATVRTAATGSGNTLGSTGVKSLFAQAGIPLTDAQAEQAYNAILTGVATGVVIKGVTVTNSVAKEAFDNIAEKPAATPTSGGYINGTKISQSGTTIAIDALNNQQKSTVQDILKNGDQSGTKTEGLISALARDAGYVELAGSKYGGNKGFDHVFQNPDGSITIVTDSKPINTSGGVQLGESNAGVQLTTKAINAVLANLPKDSPSRIAIQTARENGTLQTAVAGVDKKTGNVIITSVEFK